MILVLVVNLFATIVVNVMWERLWTRIGGDEDEFQTAVHGGDADYIMMVYNRGVERIWNFLIAYFIVILILSMIELYGAFLIFKGSFYFGEIHEKMAKLALMFLVIGFISDHLLGTFGSINSVTAFNIIGSLAFAIGIVLLIYIITVGNGRIALIAGGITYVVGRIIGSMPHQWTAITGSIIAAAGMFSIIFAYFMTLKKINRTDFSINEYFQQNVDRNKEFPISDKFLQRLNKQEMIYATYVTPYQIKKEAQKDSTIELFSEIFNISEFHANRLYEAGYLSKEDLKLATIEEILFVDGMNPTVARKIIDSIDQGRNFLDECTV